MRSDPLVEKYKAGFSRICSMPITSGNDRIEFLRGYLRLLNEFLYEQRPDGEVDELNSPDATHPEWRRVTPFLALWDDYAGSVIGFSFDTTQIRMVARACVSVFQASPEWRARPQLLNPDEARDELGGLNPKQFALIRLMHALQDFSQELPSINRDLVAKIRARTPSGDVPNEGVLATEEGAGALLAAFGGADRNVDERLRYIFSSARILQSYDCGGAYGLAAKGDFDVHGIFALLNAFPGLKRKKAHMLLRDFYELGVWTYSRHLEDIDIIADNRVMRVALRTGVIRPALGKLVNSLLDEFDFQYVLTVAATEEAFRRVWWATAEFNQGECVVSYPARLDQFIFRLADGRGGCCKPNAMACRTERMPARFSAWLEGTFGYHCGAACPFEGVCPENTKAMVAPFAIQNNTWMGIFTGSGGGGGLRGV